MEITEIAVIGLGGVGGYFGFKLAQCFQEDKSVQITFVARGASYEVIRKKGLTLISPEHQENGVKPDLLVQNVSALSRIDLVLICVKEYDLENVCRQLKEVITARTAILPLMNGMDIYRRIREILPLNVILPACVYVASHIKRKGTIEHKGMAGKIIFGKDPQFPHYLPKKEVGLFSKAGIQIIYQEDSFPEIWRKFIFIASFGLVSARYNKSIGQVNEDPELHRRALLIMEEIEAIANKIGIRLPPDILRHTFQKAESFPYQTPTSLQLDIHSKKPQNELELFAGAIIKYGGELGIQVQETKRIYREIKEEVNKKAAWKS